MNPIVSTQPRANHTAAFTPKMISRSFFILLLAVALIASIGPLIGAWFDRREMLELIFLSGIFFLVSLAVLWLGNREMASIIFSDRDLRQIRWFGEVILPWHQITRLDLTHRNQDGPLFVHFFDCNGRRLLNVNTQHFVDPGGFVRELETRLPHLFDQNLKALQHEDAWQVSWNKDQCRLLVDDHGLSLECPPGHRTELDHDEILKVEWLNNEQTGGKGLVVIDHARGRVTLPDYIPGMHELLYVMRTRTRLAERVNPCVLEITSELNATRASLQGWRAVSISGPIACAGGFPFVLKINQIPAAQDRLVFSGMLLVLLCTGVALSARAWRRIKVLNQRIAELEAAEILNLDRRA